ncbi:MAG TPA: hypothetical protein DHN33_08395 [Eubacteriaceae bacterium]|nr:hypothetical protein [Eubacteriaceae bacterium]
MRIGEFSKKHDISIDSIRYYIDIGLLVSNKTNGQYKFSESDSKDMLKIMELKNLEFPLAEIKRILAIQRLCGTNTQVCQESYLACLESKKAEIENELKRFETMKHRLEAKIKELAENQQAGGMPLGFPLGSLPDLSCPDCKKELTVENGNIVKNTLIEGSVHCDCGYRATIEEGIYIYEPAVRTKYVNGKRMPTKEEFLASSTYEHVNFLYKGMRALIEEVNRYDKQPKYIVELENCVGFFLMQYIKYLPVNTTYVMIDYDLERIRRIKKDLEKYQDHRKFIFFCCDYTNIPLKENTIDLAVDYLMSEKYRDEEKKLLVQQIHPLIKESGKYIASYFVRKSEHQINSEKQLQQKKKKELFANRFLVERSNSLIGPWKNDEDANTLTYQGIYSGSKAVLPSQNEEENKIKAFKQTSS